jgi:hypothetical protein
MDDAAGDDLITHTADEWHAESNFESRLLRRLVWHFTAQDHNAVA